MCIRQSEYVRWVGPVGCLTLTTLDAHRAAEADLASFNEEQAVYSSAAISDIRRITTAITL
jgi:hypothetical protein